MMYGEKKNWNRFTQAKNSKSTNIIYEQREEQTEREREKIYMEKTFVCTQMYVA